MRGVLVGCGFFAENHLHAWRQLGVDIAAVCDIDVKKAEGAATRHGIGKVYSSAEQMLRAEKPDFVDIVTTVGSHRSLVELASQYAVAAICQKPFALSLIDADAMIASCDRAGVPLMVHENFRWRRPMLEASIALTEGGVGRPFFGRISCRHDFDVYSMQPYLAELSRFALLDVGIHVLDLARFYFGEVETLSCVTQRANPRVMGEDVATLLLRHTEGATSVVDMSFYTHSRPQAFPQTTLEIDAAGGSIRITEGFRMKVTKGETILDSDVEPELKSWMTRPWHDVQTSVVNIQRHWLECLTTGASPATSGHDNRRTLELGLLAYDAAEHSQTIRVQHETPAR